jgi:putative tryptophan/tyrosine transport system substrate-binding protein
MNARRLLLLALAAGLARHTAPLRAQTPAANPRCVGVLAPSTQAKEEIILKPFFDQMRELGWIEGQNITYDRVYGDDQLGDLPRLAVELALRKPEVIYAPPPSAALAAQRATQTIPIVFAAVSDPVRIGLVTSLARPGGNVTGMIGNVTEGLLPKRVELLREIVSGAKRIGLLGDTADRGAKLAQQALVPMADSLGLALFFAEVANPAGFDAAVDRLIADRVDAIFVVGAPVVVYSMRARLIELANQKRLPVIGTTAQSADDGALFVYSDSFVGRLRRSALVVDKILKGAKPADIPVEQSTLFELIVNLKAAKALGITVPRSILLRADRVIE